MNSRTSILRYGLSHRQSSTYFLLSTVASTKPHRPGILDLLERILYVHEAMAWSSKENFGFGKDTWLPQRLRNRNAKL